MIRVRDEGGRSSPHKDQILKLRGHVRSPASPSYPKVRQPSIPSTDESSERLGDQLTPFPTLVRSGDLGKSTIMNKGLALTATATAVHPQTHTNGVLRRTSQQCYLVKGKEHPTRHSDSKETGLMLTR